ncbi:MAG: fibronectin type III domain-containing protein [Clostridia bacterium]|nr:fibronectin type III domain-containing protein [Clostridia bacterium]
MSGNANTSVSISGLKANTKYYVRVRSYKSAYGRRYSSSWSGVKSVVTKKLAKPAPTSISKIVSKSAAFTVSWKKQTKNTTGYQIQYSTKSNFKNNKNKSVKNKTSLTISGLKGKTKYYVRVRTYRTFGGKNYYSAWSKAKSVTTKAAATFVTIKAETYAAQVSDIYNNPSKYLGKKIQIDGLYDLEDLTSQNGGTYYYVYRLIHGAPGEEDSMCGFEFTTADGKYPSYVPKNGDTNSDHPWIRVTGILQVYYEGEGNNKTAYFTLSKATCQVMNERGAEYI